MKYAWLLTALLNAAAITINLIFLIFKPSEFDVWYLLLNAVFMLQGIAMYRRKGKML